MCRYIRLPLTSSLVCRDTRPSTPNLLPSVTCHLTYSRLPPDSLLSTLQLTLLCAERRSWFVVCWFGMDIKELAALIWYNINYCMSNNHLNYFLQTCTCLHILSHFYHTYSGLPTYCRPTYIFIITRMFNLHIRVFTCTRSTVKRLTESLGCIECVCSIMAAGITLLEFRLGVIRWLKRSNRTIWLHVFLRLF